MQGYIELTENLKGLRITDIDVEASRYLYYSRYWASDSFPESPIIGDIVYRIDRKKLYIFKSSEWSEIDYIDYILSSRDYSLGSIRFLGDQLQATSDGIQWFDCYPALGSQCLWIKNPDLQSFNRKYYILPGQNIVLHSCNHIPIVFTKLSSFRLKVLLTPPVSCGLIRLSDISTSVYYANFFRIDDIFSHSVGIKDGLYIGWGSGNNFASFSIEVNGTTCRYSGVTKYYGTTEYGTVTYSGHCELSGSSWWIGSLRNDESVVLQSIFLGVSRVL